MSEKISESLARVLSMEMANPDQHGGELNLPLSDLLRQRQDPAAAFGFLAIPTMPGAMVSTEMPEIMLPKGVFIELQQTKEHE